MSDQTLALAPPGPFAFVPQDRKARPAPGRVLDTILSLIVVGGAGHKVRDLDLVGAIRTLPDRFAARATNRTARAMDDHFAAMFAVYQKLTSGEPSQAA